MSTSRRSASRRGLSSSPAASQFCGENPEGRYGHPRRTSNNVGGWRASDDFGWTERNLFDVFLVLTKIPLAPEELEYRERQHGVADPPPSTIVTKPRAKVAVMGPLPKATAPPHPSKINVDKVAPTRAFEEESREPTDCSKRLRAPQRFGDHAGDYASSATLQGSVGSSLPSSARRGRTPEHGDGSRRGRGTKHSDHSDHSSPSDRTNGSRKNKKDNRDRQTERADMSSKESHKENGDRSHRSDISDKSERSDESSKKEKRERKKKRDHADEDKSGVADNPKERHEAPSRLNISDAKDSNEPAEGKRYRPQIYKVTCKVGASKSQKVPFKNNTDIDKTFSVSVSDTSIATAKTSSVTISAGEEIKLPIKLLPAESPGGKTVTVTLSDGKEEMHQAELKVTYVVSEGN